MSNKPTTARNYAVKARHLKQRALQAKKQAIRDRKSVNQRVKREQG